MENEPMICYICGEETAEADMALCQQCGEGVCTMCAATHKDECDAMPEDLDDSQEFVEDEEGGETESG